MSLNLTLMFQDKPWTNLQLDDDDLLHSRLALAAGVLAGVRGLAAPAPRLHLHHRQVPAARPQRPLRRPRHTLQARLHAGGKIGCFDFPKVTQWLIG